MEGAYYKEPEYIGKSAILYPDNQFVVYLLQPTSVKHCRNSFVDRSMKKGILHNSRRIDTHERKGLI